MTLKLPAHPANPSHNGFGGPPTSEAGAGPSLLLLFKSNLDYESVQDVAPSKCL